MGLRGAAKSFLAAPSGGRVAPGSPARTIRPTPSASVQDAATGSPRAAEYLRLRSPSYYNRRQLQNLRRDKRTPSRIFAKIAKISHFLKRTGLSRPKLQGFCNCFIGYSISLLIIGPSPAAGGDPKNGLQGVDYPNCAGWATKLQKTAVSWCWERVLLDTACPRDASALPGRRAEANGQEWNFPPGGSFVRTVAPAGKRRQ